MAMEIVDNLIIEVADSDVEINRRLKNTRAKSESSTTNYYTNDDSEKYTQIKKWFNDFNTTNEFYIDFNKTSQYINLLREIVLPRANQFLDNLEQFKKELNYFDSLKIRGLQKIPNVELSGENSRYLKFDNEDSFVIHFRKLILGRLTRIVFKKNSNVFHVWLELNENYNKLLGTPNDSYIELNDNLEEISNGYNKIYYGTPGSGKSYRVKNIYEKNNNIVYRTTFHPDYSNSDFIGQILPTLSKENQILYQFSPGVFAKSLLSALKNPNSKVILIIEEINRGNATAIFGDIFQLLDRDSIGDSLYHINMPLLEEWLHKNGIETSSIYIPKNMYIISTLNTNDQNVFVLDTAFKRRWKMELVSNDFSANLDWFNYYIPGSKYTWKDFVIRVNEFILDNNFMNLNNEDKRIGVYFINEECLTKKQLENDESKAKLFAHKVLMYLWEDVSKVNRNAWFSPKIKSLDTLIEEFINNQNDSLDIFSFIVDNYETNY